MLCPLREIRNSMPKMKYSEEFHLNERELETDFTSDAKSCQPDCDEQFPILRPKEQNEALIEHYLQYQPKELIDYIKQFDFQYSDITDNEMPVLIDMLSDSKDVYSLHKFDVGKTRQKFHVTLKPSVELKRQRASKVPLHLKDKLENLLTQSKDADIIREKGDDDEMGSLFVNPIILMPKNDYVKLVIDARYLNSVTDLTNYSWPVEPVQMIMTRVNGKFFSVSDLSCAYHQVPLSSETQKLTSFIIGGRQYTFTRGFYGLFGLPNFFSHLMTIHFDPLIRKKTGNYLHWWYHHAIANQRRNIHHHQWISHSSTEGWIKSCPRQDVFLPVESKVLGTRYLTRWDTTNSKTSRRLEEPQITVKQARRYESPGMSWILQLLY